MNLIFSLTKLTGIFSRQISFFGQAIFQQPLQSRSTSIACGTCPKGSLRVAFVGVYVCDKVLELRHTIKLIQILDDEIVEIEEQILSHMHNTDSPI